MNVQGDAKKAASKLEVTLPVHLWPHVNVAVASLGQLLNQQGSHLIHGKFLTHVGEFVQMTGDSWHLRTALQLVGEAYSRRHRCNRELSPKEIK